MDRPNRTDAILDLIDGGLQSSPEEAMAVGGDCVRSCGNPTAADSEFCEPCRAFMLGDADTDPAASTDVPLPDGGIEQALLVYRVGDTVETVAWIAPTNTDRLHVVLPLTEESSAWRGLHPEQFTMDGAEFMSFHAEEVALRPVGVVFGHRLYVQEGLELSRHDGHRVFQRAGMLPTFEEVDHLMAALADPVIVVAEGEPTWPAQEDVDW